MNAENFERQDLSVFLADKSWTIIRVLWVQNAWPDLILGVQLASDLHLQKFVWFCKIFAYDARDFAIRPKKRNTILGGPPMKLSVDDPRLSDPKLQYIPGGDGEVNDPPKRYELFELDQSWVIAERFEIEPLK